MAAAEKYTANRNNARRRKRKNHCSAPLTSTHNSTKKITKYITCSCDVNRQASITTTSSKMSIYFKYCVCFMATNNRTLRFFPIADRFLSLKLLQLPIG